MSVLDPNFDGCEDILREQFDEWEYLHTNGDPDEAISTRLMHKMHPSISTTDDVILNDKPFYKIYIKERFDRQRIFYFSYLHVKGDKVVRAANGFPILLFDIGDENLPFEIDPGEAKVEVDMNTLTYRNVDMPTAYCIRCNRKLKIPGFRTIHIQHRTILQAAKEFLAKSGLYFHEGV